MTRCDPSGEAMADYVFFYTLTALSTFSIITANVFINRDLASVHPTRQQPVNRQTILMRKFFPVLP